MKTLLRAAVVVLGTSTGISFAHASALNSAVGTGSVSVGTRQTPSPRTIGRIGVHVWAPVAPPYNAEANGDLAARNIWAGELGP